MTTGYDISVPDWSRRQPAPSPPSKPVPQSYRDLQTRADQERQQAANDAATAPTGVTSAVVSVNPYSSSVEDQIAAATTGVVSPYIGVEPDYKVVQGYKPTDDRYAVGEFPPGHMGHPFMPVYGAPIYTIDDINKYYAQPGMVPGLQVELYNHGYLKHISGIMDNETASALWDAYRDANKYGVPLSGPGSLYEIQEKNLATVPRDVTGLPGGDGGGGSDAIPTGPRTVINTQVNKSSRATAQQLMIQALTSELGREPTSAEVTRFLRSLNAAETAHPASVQTSQYDATGAYTGGTTVTSDLNPAMEAVNYARENAPVERRQYQGSQYFDTIANMLGL